MIALIQRVTQARVQVSGHCIAQIDQGLLALIGIRPDDSDRSAVRMLERLLAYRVFADNTGRMNLSLADTQGGLLLVPQFTLAADTRKGNRPGFSTAAAPELAAQIFEFLVNLSINQHPKTQSGEFGADMQVELVNDGPVTFWIEA